MEQNGNMGHPDGCRCHMCAGAGNGMCRMCSFGHRFIFLRWFLGLLILGLVFWLGCMVGQFHAALEGSYGGHGSYGHHRMMRFDQPMPMGNQYYGGYMMENGEQGMGMPPQSMMPAAPAK